VAVHKDYATFNSILKKWKLLYFLENKKPPEGGSLSTKRRSNQKFN
jgi:hypothetical protein